MKPTPGVRPDDVYYRTRHLRLALFNRLTALAHTMRTSVEHVVNLAIEAGIDKVEQAWKSRGGPQR